MGLEGGGHTFEGEWGVVLAGGVVEEGGQEYQEGSPIVLSVGQVPVQGPGPGLCE